MQTFLGISFYPQNYSVIINSEWNMKNNRNQSQSSLISLNSNPKVYQDAIRLLSVKPEQCALVAAHINDLRAAAQQGMRTIYVRRSTEDLEFRDSVCEKSEGGEVDMVVDSLEELAQRLRSSEFTQ